MINKVPSSELLRRYLANECSDFERQTVDAWYQTLNLESAEKFTTSDEDQLLKKISGQINQDKEVTRVIRPFGNWPVYVTGMAAMLMLALGFFYYNSKPRLLPELAEVNPELSVTVVNTLKKAIHYTLPDQSVVWLQPGSTLEHPKSFLQKNNREIKFEGEGFFEVSRDPDHPFIIYSGKLKTAVTGTSFNVRANRNDPTYHVSVVSGSVSVSASNADNKIETVLLKPLQQAVFETNTNNLTRNNLENKKTNIETWQPVSLTFEDVSLSDIVSRLQKTFRVKISVASPVLNNCVLKVDFNDQNLPEILEMINALLGSTYEMEGNNIILSGEGCGEQ